MRWRNPADELPKHGDKIWFMTEPHKERGSLLESILSVEILVGEVHIYPLKDGPELLIENNDERGYGWETWAFVGTIKQDLRNKAIAWMPVEEFPLPRWLER